MGTCLLPAVQERTSRIRQPDMGCDKLGRRGPEAGKCQKMNPKIISHPAIIVVLNCEYSDK